MKLPVLAALLCLAAAPALGDDDIAVAAADRMLGHLLAFSGAPGLAASVVIGGEVVWSGGAGWADVAAGAPVAPDTMFRLASVSKLYTAAIALRLAERELLDLDADIRRYAPEWPAYDGPVITARRLAAHIGGVGHYGPADAAMRAENRIYPNARAALDVFSGRELAATPGTEYIYSSYGFTLLSAAMEGAAGKSFDMLFERELVRPLGLLETRVEGAGPAPGLASRLYDLDAGEIERMNQTYAIGGTGVLGSARDVARFGRAFISGEVVGGDIVQASLTPARFSDGSEVALARFSIGFGWRVGESWDGRFVAHHAGATPGARSVLVTYPEDDAAVSFLSNASWTSRIETVAELLAAPFLAPPSPAADCPTGSYVSEGIFAEARETGRAEIFVQDALCVGIYYSDGELAERFNGLGEERRAFPLTHAAIGSGSDVFAIAYPWGLAPLQMTGSADRASIVLAGDLAGRQLSLQLTDE
ncbi:MAG: hypothetical protein Tsb0010_04760 [Parvularculaceae bacterium]